MSAELATKHRAAVARVVYLAQDRLDLELAAVELAKTMAVPREGDDERLERVARYLHPDYMHWYAVHEATKTVFFTTDADWPRAENQVDRTRVALCSWEIISLPRGIGFKHALH